MSTNPLTDKAIVYVVDDDQQSRKAVLTLVNTMGIQVESFSSAEEFLSSYDNRRPACLVTDVRMLGMSGLELQERLNELGISISVVVLTAFATTPTTVRAMRNGALTLMEKPCDDDVLWDAIRTGLAAAMATLALTVQSGDKHSQSRMTAAQHARVVIQRIERTLQL